MFDDFDFSSDPGFVDPGSVDYGPIDYDMSGGGILDQISNMDWSDLTGLMSDAPPTDNGSALGQAYDSQSGQPAVTGVEGGDQYLGSTTGSAEAPSTGEKSTLAKLFNLKTGSDGSIDWSDGKNLSTMLNALGTGGKFLTSIMNRGKQMNAQSAAQLTQTLPQNPYNRFTPTQQVWADRYFNTPIAPASQRTTISAGQLPSVIVPSRGYAEGGGVTYDELMPSIQRLMGLDRPQGYVRGGSSGQADDVQANLSHGEYVWDADAVSALGDGNNEAGARILDQARENLRRHKRSAPPGEIPPPAKPLESYMQKKGK